MRKIQISLLKTLLATSLVFALSACSEKAEDATDAGMSAVSDETITEEVVMAEENNPFFSDQISGLIISVLKLFHGFCVYTFIKY